MCIVNMEKVPINVIELALNQCQQDRRCSYKCNTEERLCNHCCSRQAISIAYCIVSVCLQPQLSSMQYACAILLFVACPALQYFYTLSLKRHDFRKKKKNTKYKMCVLIHLSALSETFLILRITERYKIKNVCCSLRKVPVILGRF